MTDRVVFTIDGTDVSATVTPDWSLTEQMAKGTAAISEFNLDDPTGSIIIPALKDVTIEVPAASTTRMHSGYTTDRTTQRNQDAITGSTDVDRQYLPVRVTDLNSLLGDVIIRSGKRKAESDIARINWLLASGYIPDVHDHGFIDDAHPVQCEAVDFTGQFGQDVLVNCSEQSGFNFGVNYDEGSGDATLHYRLDGSAASWTSDVLISNDPADIDDINVFAPNEQRQVKRDPVLTYSGILFQGANNIRVFARRALTVKKYRRRETSITDTQVTTTAGALRLANAYLDRIAVEQAQITCRIKLAAADVNRVKAGMRLQIKLTDEDGFTTYQWINVNQLTRSPVDGTQTFFYLDLLLMNLINTGFHGATNPPGTTNPAPGPPPPGPPPVPVGPLGITDTYNRPDDASELGRADCGRIWGTLTGAPEIVSNQGVFTGVGGGSAQLPGPWPVPFHGTEIVASATIPFLPAYLEASGWGPSWDEFNPGGVTTSVDGTVAFLDSGDTLESTLVPVVDSVEGGFNAFVTMTPGGSLAGTPDLVWLYSAAGLSFNVVASSGGFDLVASPGGPSDPGGPTFTHYGPGAWIYITYQYVLAGAVSPIESSVAVQFDTYGHFLANGITSIMSALINANDDAELDFGGFSTTIGPSIWGPPVTSSTVSAISIPGANGAAIPPGYFDTAYTDIQPEVSDFGWFWTTTGLAADGTTTLEYTAGYLSTGHAPPGGAGMWDPGTDPPAFDVPTPLIYVEVTDGVTPARGWARLPGDLPFPFSPVVDIDELGITLTIGTISARANNADASLPATGVLNAPLVRTETSGLGLDLAFDQLNITGVNSGGVLTPTGPTLPATVPLSIDKTGGTDVSVTLSDWINAQPSGSKIIMDPDAIYQAALKLHGLLNVEMDGQGCTIQAPPGGYTEDFSTFYLQSFGGSNENVVIHDFHLVGTSPTPGVFISGHEGQHGILADGSINLEVYNISCEAMFGDFLEVNSGATLIHAHDCDIPNTGRNGLSVIHGNNVEFGPNIALHTMGYMPYDVEPNDPSESCFQIYIHGDPSESWTNAFMATDGSATGADIHDITLEDLTSTGYSLLTLINPSGTAPESNVIFQRCSSDVSAAGPVLQFKDVNGLTVIHNTQALSSGVLVSDPGCTNTEIGPNP